MCDKNLPEQFKIRMEKLLGGEYEAFEEALLGERCYGLRINPLKISDSERNDFLRAHSEELGMTERVPWTQEGYYFSYDKRPGKNPLHEAGAYYIQDPSAMSVVQALDPQPGERVCDLCAAPGGKSSHIAGRMMGRGILVCNEIMTDRARILSRNMERMGVRNCIVTNEDPVVMASRFPGYFHRVVVDAPCSGEGMFRKDDTAIEEWSEDNVRLCTERQRMILDCASEMVMPGGTLCYSTCTFEPAEDELMICDFLERHPDWSITDTGLGDALSSGILPECNQDASNEAADIADKVSACVRRVWPHKQRGEGHFVAKLVRNGGNARYLSENTALLTERAGRAAKLNRKKKDKNEYSTADLLRKLRTDTLLDDELIDYDTCPERFLIQGDHLYASPKGFDINLLKGLKVISPGVELAEIKKDRVEPAHQLAMCSRIPLPEGYIELDRDDAVKFLRGESITMGAPEGHRNGWICAAYEGLPLGWGKNVNGTVKNHYPKGLRRDLSN